MTDKELDELLNKKISEIKIPEKIEKISADNLKERKKNMSTPKKFLIVASIVLIAVLATTVILYNNKKENTNTLNAENQNIENTDEIKESVAVINVDEEIIDDSADTECYLSSNIINLYKHYLERENQDYSSGFVIAKVNSLSYTNYDKYYTKDKTIEYDYVPVRTIANITIEKCLLGNYEVGAEYEIRVKGGVLEYSEYMKYWEHTTSTPNLDAITQEYNAYVQEGKTKIYVSEYKKDYVKLEEGKTYIMVINPKVWGDYWVSSYGNLLREYDAKTNSVLNNETGEYENLDELLK